MKSRSLSTRIITLSGFWVIAALVVSSLLLIYFYRDHFAQHMQPERKELILKQTANISGNINLVNKA